MSHGRLDLRSGGGLVLLAALLVLIAVTWRVLPMLRGPGATGGGNPAGYGFDLRELSVPVEDLVASGIPRDGMPVLDLPPHMPVAGVARVNDAHRGKYLVSGDLVVGVMLNGEARAYPVRVLDWHEVVNDVLGGVPIAVTYSPLCGSVAAFDRRVTGTTVEFGFSGLLHQSNLVLYDRRGEPSGSSLWSQLRGVPLAGPAVSRQLRLRLLAVSLARWDHWTARHPATTVLEPDEDRLERYRRNPYGSYRSRGKLRFPVSPLPGPGEPALMDRVLVLSDADRHEVFKLEGAAPRIFRWGSASIEVDLREGISSVVVDASEGTGSTYSFWFALYAQDPSADPLALPAH